MEPESIDKIEFRSPICLEGSWGARQLSNDTPSTMELFFYKDDSGLIEWICEELDLVENIGLTFEFDRHGKRTLTEYDGIFSLPKQAIELLEKNGVDCQEMRKYLDAE